VKGLPWNVTVGELPAVAVVISSIKYVVRPSLPAPRTWALIADGSKESSGRARDVKV